MGIIKSLKLQRISKVLGGSRNLSNSMNASIRNAMRDFNNPGLRYKVEEELFDLIESDIILKKIMQKYEVDRKTLHELFNLLNYTGAGQWIKGHYVSVSTIVNEETLDYLLKNKDVFLSSLDGRREICYRFILYFER